MPQRRVRFTKRLALIPMTMATIPALVFGLSSCQNSQPTYAGKTDSITFGDLQVESSAFVYIAEAQHLFAANGLQVMIKTYDTAPAAIDAMMKNQVDLATSGEFPFVVRVLAKENLRVIGTMDKFQAFYLIGRKDRGIETMTDLKGKSIGVVRETLPEFYLGRLLDLHGLNIRDVDLVDVKPAQWVDAITHGDVAAIVVAQSYVGPIQERLTNGMVIWPAQSSQVAYGLIYCREDWITQHPELVNRFLRSLAQAEEYLMHHPAEAKAILQKRMGYEDGYMAQVWPEHQFSLSLDQSLILAMEDEARWMMSNNLTNEKKMPDFPNYIYASGLETIRPASVNIIR